MSAKARPSRPAAVPIGSFVRGLPPTFVVFLICFGIMAALTPHMVARLEPVTGDEPFYLMTAISLLEDHDIDESNNYERGDFDRFYPSGPTADGWSAYPNPLPAHPTRSERQGLYSKHGLGLSLLVAVPFALGGRVAVVLALNALAGLAAANVWLLSRRYATPATSGLVTAALLLTLPLVPYGFLIFPELPAALLILFLTRRLLDSTNSRLQLALYGAAIGALPWLHSRFLPLSAVAFGLLVYRHRAILSDWRKLWACLAPIVASGIAYLVYLTWLYGRPRLPVTDHAGFHGLGGTINALAGLLLDAQWGLLIYAPPYGAALAALVPFTLQRRHDALTLILLALPYLLLVAAYRVWWGEWCPPARYLVPVAPLAAMPLSWLLTHQSRLIRLSVLVTLAPGVALTWIGLSSPQRLYNHPDGVSRIYSALDSRLPVDLSGYLTAFQPHAQAPLLERAVVTLLCTGTILMLMALFLRLTQRSAPSPAQWEPKSLYVAEHS